LPFKCNLQRYTELQFAMKLLWEKLDDVVGLCTLNKVDP
jgi:hypothetical protein